MCPNVHYIASVQAVEGLGTIATGVIAQGRVAPGDKVELIGFGETLESVVTGVEAHHKPLTEGVAGLSVGVRLRGVKADQISRGQVLAAPKSIRPRSKFRAEVYALNKAEGGRHTPFFGGYKPQFYVRTTDVTGVVALPEGRRDGDAGRQRADRGEPRPAHRTGGRQPVRDSRGR